MAVRRSPKPSTEVRFLHGVLGGDGRPAYAGPFSPPPGNGPLRAVRNTPLAVRRPRESAAMRGRAVRQPARLITWRSWVRIPPLATRPWFPGAGKHADRRSEGIRSETVREPRPCGCGAAAARLLPKQETAGPNPVIRSIRKTRTMDPIQYWDSRPSFPWGRFRRDMDERPRHGRASSRNKETCHRPGSSEEEQVPFKHWVRIS